MTTKELIQALQQCQSDAPVHVALQDFHKGVCVAAVYIPVVKVFQWEPGEEKAPVELQIDVKHAFGHRLATSEATYTSLTMSKNIFGWSYPPGCSGPPEYDEPLQPRCRRCGCFLRVNKETVTYEQVEHKQKCDGTVDPDYGSLCGIDKPHEPHEFVIDADTIMWVWCKRCKQQVKV